jgi:transcriptional regulator of arginine metabolism
MKSYRQSIILEIIEREPVTSQEQLRKRLRARGVDATQATLSRDIKELRLVKAAADGSYHRATDAATPVDASEKEEALRRAIGDYLRRAEAAQNIVVLRTEPGQAQILAIALDRASLDDVVGTVAGDDTLFVVSRDPRRARALCRRFEAWLRQ